MLNAEAEAWEYKVYRGNMEIRTINNKMPPTGICGTGLISVIAQLKRNRFMDEHGVLSYSYNEKGYSCN